jgi:chemotaxis protein histidine kinase CheA
MAIEKVVEIKVNTNVDNASSKLNTLKTNLKDVGNQAKQTTTEVSGLSKAQDAINAIGDGVSKLNPAFGSAIKGANGLLLKMWEMVANPVGAILAGIVVTAKFLYEAFQSSVAGGKELKTIFAAISAVGAQVKDAMFGLGRALIDVSVAAYKFITLDFKGAAESMKSANKEATESYNQLSDAVDGTTFTIIKNLEKQQQANDKARKNQAVVQSETNKLLVQSREILTDETTSIKEKKKALEEVTKAEKASSAEKVRIAAEDLRIAKARAAQMGGEAEKKAKQELRELTIALNEAETENAMTGIKLNKQRKMLNRQEVADQKEKNDAIAAANKIRTDAEAAQLKLEEDERKRIAKENLDALMASAKDALNIVNELNKSYETPAQKETREYNEKKAVLEANNLSTQLLTQKHLENLALITKTDAEKKAADDKAVEDKKAAEAAEREKRKNDVIAASKQNLSNIISGLETTGLAKTKAGQQISKALALTQIGIDSAVAISKASTLANAEGVAAQLAFPTVPGIGTIARVVSYASTTLSVLGNIARAKQLLSSGGAGGGSSSGGGGGAPSPTGGGAAAPQFNVVGNSGVNQLANVLNTQEQTPVKAYVVPSDVTTGQSLDRNIIRNASLG